jgi:DnaJ domain
MTTLYDLLGALPKDDPEELRTAFRRAAKGAHPDLHPGDPDAALKFREIVRANEILGDAEQREVYDHLLDLARLEQVSASEQATAARFRRVTSGIAALAGIAIMTAGSYLLFMQMSAASLAPPDRTAPIVLASNPAAPPPVTTAGGAAKDEAAGIFGSAAEPGGVIANLTLANLPDPRFSPADRGVILFRPRNFDRAFAALSPAKPIEKQGRARSAPAPSAAKRSIPAAAVEHPPVPVPRQRPLVQDPSREAGIAQMRLR